ncbi:MAG: hypothetical protein ACYC6P_08345 [Ignavibacteriaceae bacterium]
MELTLQDKSNYLKGLLIVAKKDNQLTEPEKQIIRDVALKLGFAKEFYEDTLKSLLVNKYIADDPIKFSTAKVAQSFVSDGLKLTFSDFSNYDKELKWLRSTAGVNNIDEGWFADKIKKYKESSNIEFALFSII